jgi:hypothetical protein
MTTRRTANRFPRRGERIAPQTLREFLMEPIPKRLLGKAASAGARLCDLDETAWQRFPAEAIAELSRMIVDRVAALYGRKVFQYHHVPRPPKGIRLEDLRLENRTRRCLVRAGFEEHPERLGDLTVSDIMSLRAFGPRCLVDLLSALESPRVRAMAGKEGGRGESVLSAELTAAAKRLAELPEARLVRREDPRFARLIDSVDSEAGTAAALAARLLERSGDPRDPLYAAEQVREIARRIEGMSHLTLEEELVQIFGSTPYERNRAILIGYYGWEDGRPHTLTEIGNRFGVTRERIRQICAKLTRKHKNLPTILAPVMDRALALIEERLPCPADVLQSELARQGLTAIGMPLESVATAARLLERPVRFRLMGVESGRLAVRPEQADAVPTIVDLAKKEIYFHGLSTIKRVERLVSEKFPERVGAELVAQTLPLVPGFSWLDQRTGWFRLLPICKHGLPKTIDKILAVAGEVTAAEMRAAMARNRRLWKEPPPEHVLLEFCRQTPGVRVAGDRIRAALPRNWKKALTGVEGKLVSVLKKHGPIVERGALEDLCVAEGMNRFSFHAFISWSPVIAQYGPSVYGLLGAEVPRQKIETLLASRRAKRSAHRVLDSHGQTDDGKIWLRYRLSRAASTYAVITVPAALKSVVRGRFKLLAPDGSQIGTLATKDGRAWGLGAFLRQRGAQVDDHILLTLDLKQRTAKVSWGDRPK